MNNIENLTYSLMETHPEDAARVLEQVAPDSAAVLLQTAPLNVSLPVLSQMLPFTSANCLERLNDSEVLSFLREIGTQTGVSLLRYFNSERREKLLTQLPSELTTVYKKLLNYPEDTVGAWMNPNPLTLRAEMTCKDALEQIRRSKEQSIIYIFVIGHDQRLTGYIEIIDLLRSDAATPLKKLVKPVIHRLQALAKLDLQQEHIGWQKITILPIFDHGDQLIGELPYSVLQRALLTKAGTPVLNSTEGIFARVTSTYWLGVSTLIQSLVSLIPNEHQERKKS